MHLDFNVKVIYYGLCQFFEKCKLNLNSHFFDLLRYGPNLSEYYQCCLEFSQFMCGPTFLSCAKNRKIILLLIASTKSQIIKTNNIFLYKKLLVLLLLNSVSEYQKQILFKYLHTYQILLKFHYQGQF